MPELPEVETIVRDLDRLVTGKKIKTVRVVLNKIVKTGPRRLMKLLQGAEVLGAERRGKFIVVTLSAERYLVVHLKMTGQFLWRKAGGDWPEHVHLIIEFEGDKALGYRDIRQFGSIMGFSGQDYQRWQAGLELGPDPFEITPEEFAEGLTRKRGRIKPLLLSQRFVSGLGNIYVDESLFAAGIHPLHPAYRIGKDKARRLHREMQRILTEAIGLRGSTVSNYVGLTGVGGQFQNRHQVYGRAGKACPVCGRTLERIVVAGRGTHLCLVCQPAHGSRMR